MSEQNAVSVYQAPDVLGNLVRLRPTSIELVPLTSQKQGAIPGKFRDEVTLEHYETITVVPLDVTQGRQMFPPYGSGNNKPLCTSFDAIVPSPYVENPPARTCALCPNSKWGKKDPVTGKGKRPACDETYKMTVILKESQLPRVIRFKGKAITSFKKFIERLETDRVQTLTKEGRKPQLFEYYFTIESFKDVKPGSITYIPLFTNIKRVSDPNMFGPFYEQYVANKYGNNDYDEDDADTIDVPVDSIGAAPDEPQFVDA